MLQPYFNAIGDDASGGVPAEIKTGKQELVNWNALSAKVSVLVGIVTIATVLHTFRRR